MSLDAKEKEVSIERSKYRVVTRIFPSTEQGEEDATTFMRKELGKQYPSLDEGKREDLFQGFREIFNNALYHGNLGLKDQVGSYLGTDKPVPWNGKSIIITLKFLPKKFSVSVQDEGGALTWIRYVLGLLQ